MKSPRLGRIVIVVLAMALLAALTHTDVLAKKKKKKDAGVKQDPYAEYVWPPPPDEARIKLVDVISGRADVEASSGFTKALLGASPQSAYDQLKKPFAVAIDPQGRILVTDSGNAALIRFDRQEGRMDVFGTTGSVRLKLPLGLDVTADGSIYVTDAKAARVLVYDSDGKLITMYGKPGELTNPTDSAVSPDGKRLFVTDSKAHKIVIYDLESGDKVGSIGEPGDGKGQFGFPTSVAFDTEGNLYVVDQINARVQVFDADGEYLDQFGALGVGYANFVRPKDIAVDEVGFIYVTDNAFNNLQLFDADFSLLTFIGEGGEGPGRFRGASGVAVHGEDFAVVDQLGRRVQLFRFVVPKSQ